MKKLFVILLLSSLILSCNDPVFYTISLEEKPIDPRIAGPTSNFAELGSKMFVATRNRNRIYCYDNGDWSSYDIGSGGISHLAATTSKLYALSGNKIIPFNTSTLAEESAIDTSSITGTIQGIYAVDNTIFIGTVVNLGSGNETHGIYYYSGSGTPTQITAPAGGFSMLVGVAKDSSNYYLCNHGSKGIFHSTSVGGSYTLVTDSTGLNFTSIINLGPNNNGDVVAMSRSGTLYKVTTGVSGLGIGIGNRVATSAIAVWDDGGTNKLLLVGRQDLTNTISTGYTHGYVEVAIDASGVIPGSGFSEPGGTGTSMANSTNEHYKTSIGKHGVNYFHQASDGVLFASLWKGVWAYRQHRNDSKFTWNAEE